MAFVEYLGNDSAVIVKRWVADHWEAVGQPLSTSFMDACGVLIKKGIAPHLVVDKLGNPVVAFAGHDDGFGIYTLVIRRWNGSSWQDLGLFPKYNRWLPVHQIAFDSQNNLIVAHVYNGGFWLLTINKLTDNGWTTLFHGELQPTRNIGSLSLALCNR